MGRVRTPVGETSMTKQANAEETDINLMVGRYMKTGTGLTLNPREPMYGDFSTALSLEDAFNLTNQAMGNFMALPAAVRDAAQNDPVVFETMMAEEAGVKALQEAGLMVKTPPSEGGDGAPKETPAPSGGGVS